MTRRLMLWVLVATGCSLGNIQREACTNDGPCQEAFGPTSTCGDNGFCLTVDASSSPEGCDAEVPGPEVPYDGIDNDCDPMTPDDDLDGDGFVRLEDCDDQDIERHLSGTLTTGVVSADQVATLCDQRCVGMTEVQGNFDLDAPLSTLEGLECVHEVAGSFRLAGTGVTTLAALSDLSRIRGDFVVEDEPALASLEGLGRLEEVDGALRLVANAQLQSATRGLGQLLRVGALEVTDNRRVSDESALALAAGIIVQGDTTVAGNGLALQFTNASFEDENLRVPDEWLVFPEETTRPEVETAFTGDPYVVGDGTFTANLGLGALRLRPPGKLGAVPTTTVYQEHTSDFTTDEAFELTGWVYVANEEPLDLGCRGYLVLKYFGPNFQPFLGQQVSTVIDSDSPQDTWTQLTVRDEVPAGAVILQGGAELAFDGTCTGTVFFDDLSLRKVGL